MAANIGLVSSDSSAIAEGVRLLARGEAGPAPSVAWVGACCKTGACVAACPQRERGLDAMLLVRIARQRAINDTKQLAGKSDAAAFPRVKTFARLQLTDEELKAWL